LKTLLDEVDKAIVSELQKDGRISLTHIGKKTGISYVAIRKRLLKLLSANLIKVSAALNVEALELKIAAILVEFEDSQRLCEAAVLFKDCPRIVFLSELSGSILLMIIACEDLSTLQSVIGRCSPRISKGIRRSEVHIGRSPIYSEFLPVRLTQRKKVKVAPCGVNCSKCEDFVTKQCLGCPDTRFYNSPF
jgi:DNA-binding Lrp family transcriptional regulator